MDVKDPFSGINLDDSSLVRAIVDYDPFKDLYGKPMAEVFRGYLAGPEVSSDGALPPASAGLQTATSIGVLGGTPEEIRANLSLQPVVRPTPLYSLPREEIEARDRYWRRVLGLERSWRDIPVLGLLGSSTLSLLGGAAQGIVDTIRLVTGDYGDEEKYGADRSALDKLSWWLGAPVRKHQERNQIAVTRAAIHGGMPSVVATKFGHGVVDLALFLTSLASTGLLKLIEAPGKVTAIVSGAAKASDIATKAFRATTAARHIDAAAKLGTFMFLTTPGGWSEKLRGSVVASAFRLTPAISSQVGQLADNQAVAFLGRTGDDFKAFALDALANFGVEVASGKVREALEIGRQEAEMHGDEEHAWAWQIANLLPILGTDLWFSWSTKSWAAYHRMLSEKFPEKLGTELNRAVTPDEYKSVLTGWLKSNIDNLRSSVPQGLKESDPVVGEVLRNPDVLDTMSPYDVIEVASKIHGDALRPVLERGHPWRAEQDVARQPSQGGVAGVGIPRMDAGKAVESVMSSNPEKVAVDLGASAMSVMGAVRAFVSGEPLEGVARLAGIDASEHSDASIARVLAGDDADLAKELIGERYRSIRSRTISQLMAGELPKDLRDISSLSPRDIVKFAQAWSGSKLFSDDPAHAADVLTEVLKDPTAQRRLLVEKAASGNLEVLSSLSLLSAEDHANLVRKVAPDSSTIGMYDGASLSDVLSYVRGVVSSKSRIAKNVFLRLMNRDAVQYLDKSQLGLLSISQKRAVLRKVLQLDTLKLTDDEVNSYLVRWFSEVTGKGGDGDAKSIREEIEAKGKGVGVVGGAGKSLYIRDIAESRVGAEAGQAAPAQSLSGGSVASEATVKMPVPMGPLDVDVILSNRDALPAADGNVVVQMGPVVEGAAPAVLREVRHPTASSQTRARVALVVVDLDKLPAPIFLADPAGGLKNRQPLSTSVLNKDRMTGMASRLDARRLLDDAYSDRGAPIVAAVSDDSGPVLVVVSGNSRMAAIRLAYDAKLPSAESYKSEITRYARDSLGVDVSWMSKPVVLRLLVDSGGEKLSEFVSNANRPRVAGLSESEKISFVADVLRSHPEILGLISPEADDIVGSENVQFVGRLIEVVGNQDWFVDNSGVLTNFGADLVRKSILAYLFDMQAKDIRLIDTVITRPDGIGVKRLLGAVIASSPAIARVSRDSMEFAEYVRDSLLSYSRYKIGGGGMAYNDYVRQSAALPEYGAAGGRHVDPRVAVFGRIVESVGGSSVALRDLINEAARIYGASKSSAGANIFGEDVPVKHPWEAFVLAVKKLHPEVYGALKSEGFIDRSGRSVVSARSSDSAASFASELSNAAEAEEKRAKAQESPVGPVQAAAEAEPAENVASGEKLPDELVMPAEGARPVAPVVGDRPAGELQLKFESEKVSSAGIKVQESSKEPAATERSETVDGVEYKIGQRLALMRTIHDIRKGKKSGVFAHHLLPDYGTIIDFGTTSSGVPYAVVRLDSGDTSRVALKRVSSRHGGGMRMLYFDLSDLARDDNSGKTIGEIAMEYNIDPSFVREVMPAIGFKVVRRGKSLAEWVVSKATRAAGSEISERWSDHDASDALYGDRALNGRVNDLVERAVSGDGDEGLPVDVVGDVVKLLSSRGHAESSAQVKAVALIASRIAHTCVQRQMTSGQRVDSWSGLLESAVAAAKKTLKGVNAEAKSGIGEAVAYHLVRSAVHQYIHSRIGEVGRGRLVDYGSLSSLVDFVGSVLGAGKAEVNKMMKFVKASLSDLDFAVSEKTNDIYHRTVAVADGGIDLHGESEDRRVELADTRGEERRGRLSQESASLVREAVSRARIDQWARGKVSPEALLSLYNLLHDKYDDILPGLGDKVLGSHKSVDGLAEWARGNSELSGALKDEDKFYSYLEGVAGERAAVIEEAFDPIRGDDSMLYALLGLTGFLVRHLRGEQIGGIRYQDARLFAEALPRERLVKEISDRMSAIGVKFEPGEGDIVGVARMGESTIEWRIGDLDPSAAGAIKSDGGRYVITISPITGRAETVSHELGHIVYDVLTPSERGILSRVLGADALSLDEALARAVETEEGRRELANKIRGGGVTTGRFIVSAINKVIDVINAVLGTSISRIKTADDVESLAAGVEDFSIIRRLNMMSKVNPGTAVRLSVSQYPADRERLVGDLRKAYVSEYVAALRDGLSHDDAAKAAEEAVSNRVRSAVLPELAITSFENPDVVRKAIIEHDSRFKPDVSNARPSAQTVLRAMGEWVRKAGHEFWTAYTMMNAVVGRELADEFAAFRQRVGDEASKAAMEYLKKIEENIDFVRKAHSAPDVELNLAVTGRGERKVRLKADELMQIAALILSQRSAEAKGDMRLANMLGSAVRRVTLGGHGHGNWDRVVEIREEKYDEILNALTKEQRSVVEMFNKIDGIMFNAISRTYKRVTGLDLDGREYYVHILRDLSYVPRNVVEDTLKGLGLSDRHIENVVASVVRGQSVMPLDPNAMSFLRALEGSRAPTVIRGIVRDKLSNLHIMHKYLESAPLRAWLMANFTSNQSVRDAFGKTFMGREFLRYFDDYVSNISGVASRVDSMVERVVSEVTMHRATTVRLASPWVWAKQPMSALGALAIFGPEYLPSLFKRDKAFINKIIDMSPFLRYRWVKKSYDVQWGVHGLSSEAAVVGKMTPGQRVEDFVAVAMSAGDRLAIEQIIMAARDYVSRNRPDLTGDAFLREVKKWAEIATQQTQVATDNLDRTMYEKNVSSPFQRMVVYMYGARAKVWNLMVMSWHSWLQRKDDPLAAKVLAGSLLGVALQSFMVGMVDSLRGKYMSWKLRDDEDVDEEDGSSILRTVFGSLIGTIDAAASSVPVVGNEMVPSLISRAYSVLGEKERARYRSAKVGQTGVFSTFARDFQTLTVLVEKLTTYHDRIRGAKTLKEKAAIERDMDRTFRRSMSSIVRWASELSGFPVNQVIGILPIREPAKDDKK